MLSKCFLLHCLQNKIINTLAFILFFFSLYYESAFTLLTCEKCLVLSKFYCWALKDWNLSVLILLYHLENHVGCFASI